MPPTPTRTLNPLPFEHLEPKRFEDLVRQLAYDFRPWRQLEATGRGGADDGFDARGFEIVSDTLSEVDERDESDEVPPPPPDRLWLIQCKRERALGPTKLRAHLDAIPPESLQELHGILFVGSCDFSKKARDTFRVWCIEKRLEEAHIWGRAEIEDLLLQGKNDGLLFAYFGISLQIRRRKVATDLRRRITIKRKLTRLLKNQGIFGTPVIVRDPADEEYPYGGGKSPIEAGRLWQVVYAVGLGVFGLKVLCRQHFAYYDHSTQTWDIASKINTAAPQEHENPWHQEETAAERELDRIGRHFWLSLPDAQHYTAKFVAEINYDDIIEIDDVEDEIKQPTVFVTFRNGKIPFSHFDHAVLEPPNSWFGPTWMSPELKHVRVFPEAARDDGWEQHWAANNGLTLARERTEIQLTPPEWIARADELAAAEAEKTSDQAGDDPDVSS